MAISVKQKDPSALSSKVYPLLESGALALDLATFQAEQFYVEKKVVG